MIEDDKTTEDKVSAEVSHSNAVPCYVKLAAIMGGGDWADASVDHVKLRDGVNLDAAQKEYRHWYENEYRQPNSIRLRPQYYTFTEWLIKHEYAIEATEDDIEIFGDDF